MVTRTYKYTGSDMADPSTTPTGYVASDGDNLLFTPMMASPTVVEGTTIKTHFPLESRNVLWTSWKNELYRYTEASPVEYETLLQLYGLNSGGEELVGEQLFTTTTSPGTTEVVGFDLTQSACTAPLTVETGTGNAGKLRVNLPVRYSNYETLTLTHRYHFTDNFNDASIGANWTVSTPAGSIWETTTLNILLSKGVNGRWDAATHNAPITYTPIPSSGDWVASVTMNSYTVNDKTMAGFMLYKDCDNVWMVGRRRDDELSINGVRLNKIVNNVYGSVVTVPSTTLPMHFLIAYINGTYYFYHSTTGTGWSYVYSTNSLGFVPTHVGMFASNWGSYNAVEPTFDNFSISTKTGNSTYDVTTIPSATPADDDLYIQYPTPANWRDMTYTDLTHNRYGDYPTTTNAVPLNAKGISRLGYSGLDKFDGLREIITTTSTDDYITQWNWSEVKYEV